jgi:hypothetical protein
MAASADDLGFVGDSFTMGAAVFRAVGRGTATGGIRTFLGVSHNPPLPGARKIRATCPADGEMPNSDGKIVRVRSVRQWLRQPAIS